ncbi:Vmc-like lipoprotein signal peptide domain-containing protein [Mycoplasma bradburyae]|uniref:Vmc-like lipoprotein signal peptide domain-containing protein n=1 Tax=Mycoplasma bradburyae TaxID=2963128 RepID=UPI0023412D29|nr:hypothetical protein [Mycoplasma bradburyae]MDC4184473.1 hypothetical protein [Mycoplasma bradburyae]
MKQKTKKLLQLSFSLGFLATTALVATSCNQPKTVTPKPTNPMQPGNGSGSGTTTTPGTGETMQPGNGSGSGTGIATSDNTEAKNQLDTVINAKDANLALYSDYSMIKSELTKAYKAAKSVSDKTNASKEELVSAKTTLEAAVNKAKTDKMAFDTANSELVTAYAALKNKIKTKDASLQLVNEDKYILLKNYIGNLYERASAIISDTLQANPKPEKASIDKITSDIDNAITNIEQKKTNIVEYSKFKLFEINNEYFKGNTLYSATSPNDQNLVGFLQDFNNSDQGKQWKYAKRTVAGDIENSDNITNVKWIYSLDSETGEGKTAASYEITFTYYGGSNATLYFPYKLIKSEEDKTKISLKYKLNDNEIADANVSDAKVNEINVAKIHLTNLVFGENKIVFSTETNKTAPMIGNIYIAATDETSDDIYNDIFGNEVDNNNPNKITINFVKGYGLAKYPVKDSQYKTNIKKFVGKLDTETENKTSYLIGYLGSKVSLANSDNEKYYIFYLNVPKDGQYEISGIYNSGTDGRGLTFWKGSYDRNINEDGKVAKFNTSNTGNWDNTLKKFGKEQSTDMNHTNSYLQLTKGLNKIIVSGKDQNADGPNLGNVTFTLRNNDSSDGANSSIN